MKDLQDFNYRRDITSELQLNDRNRQALFGVKFIEDITKQQSLTLNSVHTSSSKKHLLKFMEEEHVLEDIRKRLQSDFMIQKFLKSYSDSVPSFEALFEAMKERFEVKSQDENTSLTFYNQYVDLHKDIDSCFQFKKNFSQQGRAAPKETIFQENFVYSLTCRWCPKMFKKNSGLRSHEQNYCKARKELEKQQELEKVMLELGQKEDQLDSESISEEGRTKKRTSKRKLIHKYNTLNESSISQ